jgi:hypothetical protein
MQRPSGRPYAPEQISATSVAQLHVAVLVESVGEMQCCFQSFVSLDRMNKCSALEFLLMIYFLLILALCSVMLGLSVSVIPLYFVSRRGPIRKDNQLSCVLGIALGIFLWISFFLPMLSASFYHFSTGNIFLILVFMGGTPIAALPALLLYGPGRR